MTNFFIFNFIIIDKLILEFLMNILPITNFSFNSRHKKKQYVKILFLPREKALDYVLDRYLPVLSEIRKCKKNMATLSPTIFPSVDGDAYSDKIASLKTLKHQYNTFKKIQKNLRLNLDLARKAKKDSIFQIASLQN